VASAREVGEWVERVASEDLAERRRLVEIAEASGSMPSAGSSESPTAAHDDVAPGARPHRGVLAGLVVVGLVLLVGAIYELRGRDTIAAAPVAALPSDAAVEGSAVASQAVDAPTSAPSAPSAPGGSASPGDARPPAAAAHAPKKRAAPCKPYVIDKDGRKQFNEACFR
jgi:hypothetical protein